jgi:DNA-binding beta-propeller fold protein YncE
MRNFIFAFLPVLLTAQTLYIPAYGPAAQELVVTTKNAHPELQKLGLHAIPPAQHDYAIIANAIPSKIGKKSSESDLSVLYSGTPSVKPNDAGRFFDLCLPISDAIGRPIGITVMEIPFASAADSRTALAKATAVRNEMQRKIKSHAWLFAESSLPLTKVQSIQIPDVRGRFDHLAADARHNRLFAAAEDERAILVFDLVDGRMTGKIPVAKPHAIVYREDRDRIYVTDGEEGALKIFDGGSYQPRSAIALAKDADSIGFDVSRHYLYIDNGGKDAGQTFSLLSVVDTDDDKKVADIRVEGDTLEAMALDVFRPRLYVNNRAKNQVVVIDRWTNKIAASWPVSRGTDNVALALDEQHQRLFVGCRGGQIVVFDSNTGKELQSVAITKGIDDLQFDPASRRLYAIGGGKIDVIEEISADDFRSLGTIATGEGAKTGRLAQDLNRYFAAVPQLAGGAASVEVFQPLNLPDSRPAAAETPQPVKAPRALQLEMATLSAHPDLRKMGLHAVPPGGKDSVIIAQANMSRIGIKSSSGDLAAVKDGGTYCAKRDDASFFNMKLPLKDAPGNTIGILVMEIPYTSAADEKEAVRQAEAIRSELARQIPSYQWLFAE